MEIHNPCDEEYKVMMIKILAREEWMNSARTSTKIKNIKNNQPGQRNTMIEMNTRRNQ